MRFKSTYFYSLSCAIACVILNACVMEPLSENYNSVSNEYTEARTSQIAKDMVEESVRGSPTRRLAIQNPNNVPVIINDPFAVSASIAANAATAAPNGLGGNVFVNTPQGVVQSNNPYGSLASSDNRIIKPNVMMQNSFGSAPLPQPTFGQNYYRPY